MRKNFLAILFLVTAFIDSGGSRLAYAQFTTLWEGAINSDFNNGGNWDLGIVPGPVTSALFALPNIYNVDFPTAPGAIGPLDISGGEVTFDLNGFVLEVAATASVSDFADPGTGGLLSVLGGDINLLPTGGFPVPILSVGTTGGDGQLVVGSGASIGSTAAAELLVGSGSPFSGSVTVEDGGMINMADVYIGGSSIAAGGPGNVTVSNAGQLNATGTIRIWTGGSLGGNSSVTANQITIDQGGALNGTLTITGSVSNSGKVTPGFSPGITTISDDYIQSSEGLLEIEIEGLTAGLEHDKLVVSGDATLDGRLDVPVTAGPGFPVAGNVITFLTTSGPGGVMGRFNSLSSPNLATAAPGLALLVDYSAADVKLRFVAPVAKFFIPPPGPSGPGNWFDGALWTGGVVPDSTHIVQLVNETVDSKQVNVEFFGPPNTLNAFAHELNISGDTNSMTLAVSGDSILSVTNSMVVGNNGVLDLTEGGTVTTHCLRVSAGGLVSGNGTINSNTILGTAGGTGSATLSPGNSTGVIEQNGDLQILSNGVVEIELVTDNTAGGDYDQVNVSGEVTYGGTLMLEVMAADYTGNMPTAGPGNVPTFDVITSGSRSGSTTFDEVLTTTDIAGVYLAASYSSIGASASLLSTGDMNANGELDDLDPEAFAMAITDPAGYHGKYGVFGFQSGNFDGDDDFDFDDIEGFLMRIGGLTAAALFELIDEAAAELPLTLQTASSSLAAAHSNEHILCNEQVPEPATGWLLLIGVGMVGTRYSTHHVDPVYTSPMRK